MENKKREFEERSQKRKRDDSTSSSSSSSAGAAADGADGAAKSTDEQPSKRQKVEHDDKKADEKQDQPGLLLAFEGIGEGGASFKELKEEFRKHGQVAYVELSECGSYVLPNSSMLYCGAALAHSLIHST